MSKMLDILEAAFSLCGFSYVRLDGSTKTEFRQPLVEYFNNNPKLFIFMSSTRSGGIGLNLTSADTVIFYDSDWNPAMDRQAQDRCHRIGQTRDVTIYRLISVFTIEENILLKNMQKTQLDRYVMEKGEFNQETLSRKVANPLTQFNVKEILGDVLGSQFKNVSLASYQNTLKRVEDKEDYETAKQAMKDTEDQLAGEDPEEPQDPGSGQDQFIDVEKITQTLPPVTLYGIKMIDSYSGNFDAFKEEGIDEADEEDASKSSAGSKDDSQDEENGADECEMRPPQVIDRASALSIIKEEKARFQKLYGFA